MGILALMLDYSLEYDFIVNEISKFGKYGNLIKTILNYVKTDCVSDLLGELNSEFDSDVGNRAYPP